MFSNPKLTIAFFVTLHVICFIVMMTVGPSRGWNVKDGEFQFFTVDDDSRFLPEPNASNPEDQLIPQRAGPEAYSNWYYWRKKDPDDVGVAIIVWILYAAHQIAIWYLQFSVQFNRDAPRPSYSWGLAKFNIQAMAINTLFHYLHLMHTQLVYDACAIHAHEASSQSSVILLLVAVLVMEYKNRGVLFGLPRKHWPSTEVAIRLIRKYHGYVFSWGAIYTFWYHPMESTWGHLMGFLHTAIIMLQGSLMYTNYHLNVYWRLLLEVWVLFHAGVIAYQSGFVEVYADSGYSDGSILWPMFVFGFGLVLVLTQIHGIPWLKEQRLAVRMMPFGVYVIILLLSYGLWIEDKDGNTPAWSRLQEPIRIPALEYIYMLVLILVVYFGSKMFANCVSKWPRWVRVTVAFSMYIVCIVVSIVLEQIAVQAPLLTLTFVLLTVFAVSLGFSTVVLSTLHESKVSQADKVDSAQSGTRAAQTAHGQDMVEQGDAISQRSGTPNEGSHTIEQASIVLG